MRTLQIVHACFAHELEEALGNMIGPVTVTLLSLQESPMIAELSACAWRVAFASPQGYRGTMEYSAEFALLLIDHLLNCQGDLLREACPLSQIEQHMLREATVPLLDAYAGAWSRFTTLRFQPVNTDGADMAGEQRWEARYTVHTSQGNGCLQILLPRANWEGLVTEAGARQSEIPLPATGHPDLLTVLEDCNVTVRAILGRTRVTVRELLHLAVGDIICLEQQASAPIDICIGNQTKLRGTAQVEDGAFIITTEAGVAQRRS